MDHELFKGEEEEKNNVFDFGKVKWNKEDEEEERRNDPSIHQVYIVCVCVHPEWSDSIKVNFKMLDWS